MPEAFCRMNPSPMKIFGPFISYLTMLSACVLVFIVEDLIKRFVAKRRDPFV